MTNPFKNFQPYLFYYSFLVFQILINLFQLFFPVSPQISNNGFIIADSSGLLQLQPIWVWSTISFQIFIFFFGIYLVLQLALDSFIKQRNSLIPLILQSSLLVILFSPVSFIFLFSTAKSWSLQILGIDFYNKPMTPFLAEISLTLIFLITQFFVSILLQRLIKSGSFSKH